MTAVGKLLVVLGLVLVLLGLLLWLLGRIGFHGLPGDIVYETEHVKVYFPLATCLVLSLVLSGFLWLLHWLTQR